MLFRDVEDLCTQPAEGFIIEAVIGERVVFVCVETGRHQNQIWLKHVSNRPQHTLVNICVITSARTCVRR